MTRCLDEDMHRPGGRGSALSISRFCIANLRLVHRWNSVRALGGSRFEVSSMDPLKCQTSTATPAEPGGLPYWASGPLCYMAELQRAQGGDVACPCSRS